jgi:ADP-ribosylglycohydrolase
MLGAIYGDKAGSIYEFGQTKKVAPVITDKLIMPNSFYSDDTIETVAIIDAIINHNDYESTLKKYILEYQDYKPNFSPYFSSSFSPNTIKWAKGEGRSDSKGNGALMRISPVGFLFNSYDDVVENAYLATIPSHNSYEAIDAATTVALMIYYFRKGYSKEEVLKALEIEINYKPFKKFNTTCRETLGNCLFALYNSYSFEDAIRKVLFMGGDTDTNACIVGSIAEALYGLNNEQKEQAEENLPQELSKVLKMVYK